MYMSDFGFSAHLSRVNWRGNGAERWRTTVFDGTERSPENRDNGPLKLNWSFETILAITSTDGIRPGSVRDAEVPGSNPGSPTQKDQVRASGI
jgi:hypothetical protein